MALVISKCLAIRMASRPTGLHCILSDRCIHTQKPRSKLGAPTLINPLSAPAKIQTSRLPSPQPTKGAEQKEAGLGQDVRAPDEVVASLHGEAAVAEQPVKMGPVTVVEAVDGQQTPESQHQRSFPQTTEALRKGQEAGRSGGQDGVVFPKGQPEGPGNCLPHC